MNSKKERTRELILNKSYELFAKNGFKQITMKDVCEATGLSRGDYTVILQEQIRFLKLYLK